MATSPAEKITSGNAIFYLNGRRMVETPSSVLVSSSPWLNDARVREWIGTENLRRNGVDYPLLYGIVPLLQGIDDCRDIPALERLFAAERARNPAFDRFMEEGFLSTFTRDDLAQYGEGTVGGALYAYMIENDLSPNLHDKVMGDPDWRPKSSIEYWDLRMSQTHDFFHILGEVGFSTVAEYYVTGVMTGNVFRHVGAELAGHLMVSNTLVMFPWMTRCMLHYGEAWPALWHNISHGYEVGEQSDPLFSARFEGVLDKTPAEARAMLGMRGFRPPVDSSSASLVFGEGREIF
ncbi:MAG: Coq4 family protein [Novosphingobium sp.]